jgi:hypothetical protein
MIWAPSNIYTREALKDAVEVVVGVELVELVEVVEADADTDDVAVLDGDEL